MSNTAKIVLGVVAVLSLVVGVVGYTVLRPPAEASAPIEAIPLATATTAAAAGVAPTAVPAAPTATDAPAAPTATDAPAAPTATETPATPTPVPATATPAPAAEIIFSIVPAESQARFIIDEVLNNAPFTVVGATDQIAGQLAVSPASPGASRVGVIQINARTLATDSEFRDRAIKNSILSTDQHEFITFEPTALSGLPATGAVGETYSFQMTGNLTIRTVTQPVTFDVTITPVAENRLEGSAVATVLYPDFGLTIPEVPSVASVDEDVRLELDFVAVSEG